MRQNTSVIASSTLISESQLNFFSKRFGRFEYLSYLCHIKIWCVRLVAQDGSLFREQTYGSNPTHTTNIAEWRSGLSHLAHNQKIGGSNPSSATNFSRHGSEYQLITTRDQ